MYYGFMDESGSQGIAEKDNDYLVVSLVVFKNEKVVKEIDEKINNLRLKLSLPKKYEFHYSRNSNKTQRDFTKFLKGVDFEFLTISIKKDKTKKHGSYKNSIQYLLPEIINRYEEIFIEMDSNPILHKELKSSSRKLELKNLKCTQSNSKEVNMLQVADYVVGLCSRKVKGSEKAVKEFNLVLRKKQACFFEI